MVLILSPLNFSSRLSHLWIWACPLLKTGYQSIFFIQLRFLFLPSEPIRVMSSRSVYLSILFLGRLKSFKWLTRTCAYSFVRNRQLPFLNQQKAENYHRKYSMINLHKIILPDLAGITPSTSWSPVGHTSNWATEARVSVKNKNRMTNRVEPDQMAHYESSHLAYMPYLTLWDKISQNFGPSGPHFP